MQGGGVCAGPLTADLAAHAIVAAARTFGDCPVKAFTNSGGKLDRRCMAPAVDGLASELRLPLQRVSEVMGVKYTTVRVSRSEARPSFLRASRAAQAAVREELERRLARSLPKPDTDNLGPAARRILENLPPDGASAPSIAVQLDMKEAFVGQELRNLQLRGLVRPDDVPIEGLRYRKWKRREGVSV